MSVIVFEPGERKVTNSQWVVWRLQPQNGVNLLSTIHAHLFARLHDGSKAIRAEDTRRDLAPLLWRSIDQSSVEHSSPAINYELVWTLLDQAQYRLLVR